MASKKHTGSGDYDKDNDKTVFSLKQNGRFNAVGILPLLLDVKENILTLAKPSIFNNEMQMSAEDRIHKLTHTREKATSRTNMAEKIESFKFFPKVVVFQNFHPGKVYKIPVTVRNVCQVMKPLQITYEESQYFSVSFTSGLYTRIAPGMSAVLMIHFNPEDKKDYSYTIALQCNKEYFNIPIIAIGPRPILDFPDDIHIPSGPIKIRCTKVVLVRNIGDVAAIFSLTTNSPFEVEPKRGVLRPSEMMNVRVSVTPKKCGNIQGILKISYESGEDLYSQLHGIGEEANIWMDKSSVTFEESYVGVKQMATVTVHNGSDYLLNFKWKKMATIEKEFIEYDKLTKGYSFMKNLESQKYSKLSMGGIVDPETHERVYNRMLDDEVKALKNEEFLFHHSCFSLRPLSGDIWPKSSIDIMVNFEPDKPDKHAAVAYCDIPGHEKRLPLALNGFVKGPQFAFNLDVLDIDCVFVYKTHYYEVVVKNVGLIPGTIAYLPTETHYGGKILCSPDSIGLMPEECKTFLVSFSSNVQGEFFENILFRAQESDEIFKIELKGSVVTPTFTFNVKSLDFGVVPFSFPVSHSILLQNLSMVPVHYKLTMKGDGTDQSVSYKKFAESKDKPRFPKNPQEYLVSPTEGTVSAYSSTKIKVTLTANIIREKKSTLAVEMLDAVSVPVCLPITHTAAFPTLECTPYDINIRFCFINYPYTRTIVLENKSNVMGFFHIIPQSITSAQSLSFSTTSNEGIINAGSKTKVPLTIQTSALGMQSLSVSMIILGDDAPKEICTITGCGQGPVVTVEPHLLDYGAAQLLNYITREFILTNDSPVPANFVNSLTKKNSPWEIAPQSGVLEAENNITVEVTTFIRDVGKYKDTIQIEITGSRTLQVALSADGVGTSLLIEPVFSPVYDLGSVLTTQDIERKFTISNEGNRHHQIFWSHMSVLTDARQKIDEIPVPIFQFEPNTLHLAPREGSTFAIRGFSRREQHVAEKFYCHGIIGNKRDILIITTIKAHFIDPKVIFSKPELNMKVRIGENDKYQILFETVDMQNITDLTYEIELKTEYPFFIMGVKEPVTYLPVLLNSLATIPLTIIFDSSCVLDLYSRKFESYLEVKYRDHPHVDILPLCGEVNFPNMQILPPILDFGCVPMGCEANLQFDIVNKGDLPVTYHWYRQEQPQEKLDERKSECSSISENLDKTVEDRSSESELTAHKEDNTVQNSDDVKEIKPIKKQRISKATDDEIKAILFPIIAPYFKESSDYEVLQYLSNDFFIKNEFEITPHFGQLGPNETQTISAMFGGKEQASKSAVLVCQVVGGPTQVMKIKGQISPVEYALDKMDIDIGHQIFCIPSSHTLKLMNTGRLPFEFSVDLKPDVPDKVTSQQIKNIRVEPISGKLPAKQFQEIQVNFYPGFINKFHETFSIQIGYLEPVSVTLTGYGVIPQLYAFLPRPKSFMLNTDIGFQAINSLLLEQTLTKKKKKNMPKSRDLSLFGRNISKKNLEELKYNEWTVIAYEDEYPTVADIDLAVERALAQDFVKQCSFTFLKHLPKHHSLPGLIVPSYDIDLGIVMVGTSVSYSSLFYNYGPINVSGSFQFSLDKDVLGEMGFSFKLPFLSKLSVDQTVAMQIYFNPTKTIYREKQHNVEYTIFLQIFSGACIPIDVHAIVTHPYLITSLHRLDFDIIKCGERKIMTFTIKNDGLVPCKWHGGIKPGEGAKLTRRQERDPKPSFSFSFLESKSTLQPQQTLDVDVIFHQTTPGFKESCLVIRTDNSTEVLTVLLTGTVVEPQLTCMEQTMEFEPTLPYPENCIKGFKIANSSNYPIEFYLPLLDSQILEEERIIRVLCDYYQTDKLYLPIRNIGEQLPKEITQFYQNLVGAMKAQDDEVSSQNERKKKKRKSRTERPRPSSATASALASNTGSQTTVVSILSTSDSFIPQDPDQLEDLLHERMDDLRQKFKTNPNNDPVKAANDAIADQTLFQEKEPSTGLVLMFYGAPNTNFVYVAHKTAKYLDFKLLNIDDVILQVAATGSSSEAIKLRDKINSCYTESSSVLSLRGPDLMKEDELLDSDDEDTEGGYGTDPVDEMTKKVRSILTSPRKDGSLNVHRIHSRRFDSSSQKGSYVQPTSQQSVRRGTNRKGNAAVEPGVTIPGVTLDLLEEVLKGRFSMPDCHKGIVIDHLKSIFFETPALTLTAILRAIGFAKYIHLFLFYNTFEKYADLYTSEKLAAEEQARIQAENKLALFETLTTDDIEAFSEKDQALYEDVMLAKRREEWRNKKIDKMKQKEKAKDAQKRKSAKLLQGKKGNDVTKKQSRAINSSVSESLNPVHENEKKSKGHSAVITEDNSRKKSKNSRSAGSTRMGKQSVHLPSEDEYSNDELASTEVLFRAFESEYNDILTIALNWDKKKITLNMSATPRLTQQSGRSKSTRKSPSLSANLQSRAKLSDVESPPAGSRNTDSLHEALDEESIATWIFDCSKPDPYKDELLIELLTEDEDFNSSRSDTSLPMKKHPTILNCVAVYPKRRQKVKAPEEFTFCYYNDAESFGEDNDAALDVPDKGGNTGLKPKLSRRRSSKSRKSDADNKPEPVIVEASKQKTRWVLNPGENMEIGIKFDPHSVGEYHFKFPLETTGCNRRKLFNVRGQCDVPRIDMDPYVVFDHVVKAKNNEKLYRLTYFLDKTYFDFGAIIITKSKDKRLHHIATSFNISNISTIPAEVRFSYLDKNYEKVDTFAIEPMVLFVQPQKVEKVTVFATPRNFGATSETILLSIKDNPAVEQIKVSCTGVKVDFEVDPKVLIFDHVLVFRKAFRMLKLKNKSLVPVIWHFIGFDDAFLEQFDISSTEGLIMPLDVQDIRIEFFATRVLSNMKKHLKIEVFDEEGRGDPLCVETITIIAESVDVIVDISFEDSKKNYVDFGRTKVGTRYTKNLYLRNKGKHDVTFKFEIDIPSNVTVANLNKMLSITPETGVLPHSDKSTCLEVECYPRKEIHLYAVPVFKCYLLDGHNLVATIPIQVSILAEQCRYIIQPKPDLNFGPLPLGGKKTLPITIKNVGAWEITYILSKEPRKTIDDDGTTGNESVTAESLKTEKKDELRSLIRRTKSKSYRHDVSPLSLGIFTITPSFGYVKAGEIATLQVECTVEYEGTFSETLYINVPEKSPDDPLSGVIDLHAMGCVPSINFADLSNIFEEVYICDKLEDIKCPCDMQSHSVFVKEENKLLFSQTCLGLSNTVRIKMKNSELVPCDLTATISKQPMAKSMKSSDMIFTVVPNKLCVLPYNNEYFEITFTPLQIGVYNYLLEIAVEALQKDQTDQKDKKFAVKLVAEGCVPIITLIEPKIYPHSDDTDLVFPPTLLGKKAIQKLKLQNTGSIPCHLMVEFSELYAETFSIVPNEETVPLIVREQTPGMQRASLAPGIEASFEVTFIPRDLGKFSAIVKMYTIGNPYEKISVNIIGECYADDITMDLPSVMVSESKDKEEEAEDDETICQYILDFKYCYVGGTKKISFKMNNHSQKNVYRFDFTPGNTIIFTPTIGHLNPNSSKEVIASLVPREPMDLEEIILVTECYFEKIVYPVGQEGTSWDDRCVVVRWKLEEGLQETNSQEGYEVLETEKHEALKYKVVESAEEPAYERIGDTFITISLQVFASVDYCRCACDISYYEFPETLMYQNNTFELTLSNTGEIPWTYRWNVVRDIMQLNADPQPLGSSVTIDTPEDPNLLSDTGSDAEVSQSPSIKALKRSITNNMKKMKSEGGSEVPFSEDDKENNENLEEGMDRASEIEDSYIESTTPSHKSQDSFLNGDILPFKVEPSFGIVDAGREAKCKVTFAPVDIFDYRVLLVATIPHLDPDIETPKIIVKGRSIMPLCHFEFNESDYLTSGRRDLSLPGPLGLNPGIPLDADTKVIEFEIVGIGDTHFKQLLAMNPTEMYYSYLWENLTTPGSDTVSMFYCKPLKGYIESNRQIEMSCNFIAHDVGTFESFWNFVIPECERKYSFLFVGHVREPSVCFLCTHITLCPTVVGVSTVKYTSLVSNEDAPLKFCFARNSLFSEGQSECLEIKSIKGKVVPGEECLITVQFTPKQPGITHFDLKCHVQGMKKPLSLSVTGECYSVQPLISYEREKGQIINLSPTQTNVIDFGEVSVKCSQNIIFRITNVGKATFYYYWQYDEQMLKQDKIKISFQSRGGHVTSQSRATSSMTWMFFGRSQISDLCITLQVNKGPDYIILLRGKSTRPDYVFSPSECKFGQRIFKETLQYKYKENLQIKNNDEQTILIECFFKNTPYFTMENANGPIPPGDYKDVLITFSPQAIMKYEETVEFIVNGCTKQQFRILGEGVDYQVGLQNPQHKLILFAPVLPGGSGFACIPVINNGKNEVTVEFLCGKEMLERRMSTCSEEPIASILLSIHQSFEDDVPDIDSPFEVSPVTSVTLKPQQVVNLCVKFSPTSRTKLVSEKIYLKLLNHLEPLCILQGSCVGPVFSFDRNVVPFGGVLKGCTSTQKFKLINSGEVGAKFKWETDVWSNTFSINPMMGYSSPDTEITFTVEFTPKDFQKTIRHVAVCSIGDITSLELNIAGACWEEPVAKETVSFNTPVRVQEKKSIPLTNKTGVTWSLGPRITGQYFHGSEIITVPPYGNSQYEVTYIPLVMTEKNDFHTGSIVFCLPEGQALAYNLSGTSEAPISCGKLVREIPCKETYTEALSVSNWLTTSQRFIVTNEVGKTERTDLVYFLTGNEYIDVSGASEREYKWIFNCYKECILNIKVLFTNILSKEYLFYEMVMRVVKRGPLEVFNLATPVRQPLIQRIKLDNPLTANVIYTVTSVSPEIYSKSPLTVTPQEQLSMAEIEYTPLFPGKSVVSLDVSSNELGSFPYELVLTALPPIPEKLIKCTTSVGSTTTMEAVVPNLSKVKADFSLKVDNRDFETDKQIGIASRSKGSVVITFEPTSVGNINTTLKASSSIAGEIEFPLLGVATVPRPQGPFSIKAGSSITIPFKNIFFEKLTFAVYVDSPQFAVKNAYETIRPKKETRISVTHYKSLGPPSTLPVTAKISVSCTMSPMSNIKWTYYLKGVE